MYTLCWYNTGQEITEAIQPQSGEYFSMQKIINIPILFLMLLLPAQKEIFLIGDSTVASYPQEEKPMTGWGEVIGSYFSRDLRIYNYAKSGASTKSFRDEGLWDKVIGQLGKGDYLFIQFGHNDQKTEPQRHSDPFTSYKSNLKAYVREAESKGAIPVIVTPPCRRRFRDGELIDTLGDYPAAAREAADEADIYLIDLHRSSFLLLESLGKLKSKNLFLHFGPGKHRAYPDGREDDTHFSRQGADEMARLVVKEIRNRNMGLSDHLRERLPEEH